MNSPTPLPAASPPERIRSDRLRCWPPSASGCPRSAWSRWSPSSPRGSTRTEARQNSDGARSQLLTLRCAAEPVSEVWMRRSNEEREWWETAPESPLKFFFVCLFDVWEGSSADKYDKLLRVFCVRICVRMRRMHLGSTELLRSSTVLEGKPINPGGLWRVDRPELPWSLQLANRPSHPPDQIERAILA